MYRTAANMEKVRIWEKEQKQTVTRATMLRSLRFAEG